MTDEFLDAGMRGFIVNTARQNFWRVASWYEFDDLVQDGYLCYYKCRRRYTEVTDRPHFMSLVKTAFTNHIMTLGTKHNAISEQAISQMGSEDAEGDLLERLGPATPESTSLLVLLANAPAELQQLITALVGEGAEKLGFQRKKEFRRHIRETTNEYYCRLLGKDPETADLVGELRAYFD